MKNRLYKYHILFALAVLCLCFGACKKSDSPYHDYVNNVQTFNGSAYEYLKAQPKGTFDNFLSIVDKYPDLVRILKDEKVTLFVPVNKNFEVALKYLNEQRVKKGKSLIDLDNADPIQLLFMTCKYILKDNKTTDDYMQTVDGIDQEAVGFNYPMHVKYVKLSSSGYIGGGPAQLTFSDPRGVIFTKYWVNTTTDAVNIKTNNGTINILTSSHQFGFDEFTVRLDN
ncbi:hypothetical protein EZ428_09540 [Pedobacter frigiditerrae]|uniref:Fasciclin domain-containing protein n=1 Tax=Pedobacter frigiditerrae TaxID=2530452 RepID=A0A4R0MYI0_9SPHI|nr:hypothetical protein [Pedobacter frigiditerrae]TCC91973.1 hypothetical protein EZ428_09540 [Pedobacter frigiditerrae]